VEGEGGGWGGGRGGGRVGDQSSFPMYWIVRLMVMMTVGF